MTDSDHRAGDTPTVHDHARRHAAPSRRGGSAGGACSHAGHHAHMVADFRRRFWVSLVLSVPVLVLDPMLQHWAGLEEALAFPGDRWVQFFFASAVYFYGVTRPSWPPRP